MKKFIKSLTLIILAVSMLIPFSACKEDENRSSQTLSDKLMEEAQIVTDFMKDEGFIYGDAKINPAINWAYLDPEKADDPNEKIVSCDRLVDWILYRAGFTNQPYSHGMNVWSLITWCEEHNFEKLTDVNILQAGDIVFVNPDSQNMPKHVFMCASDKDENGNYLRYDAGSNERIQCIKGTEVNAGHQPFLEPIGGFMYAYRPNDSTLDTKYAGGSGSSVPVTKIEASFEISKGTATVDGTISKDEYKSKYSMDSSNCSPWVGTIGSSNTDIYFAWDKDGLYYAAEVFDNTPSYGTSEEHWVGVDCVQLGINPVNLIKPGKMSGIIFTFGAEENGNVVTYRHNYDEKIISEDIVAKASNHKDGASSYIIEAFIPWDCIKLSAKSEVDNERIDTTGFSPASGTEMNLLPCVIDAAKGSQNITCAYKHIGTGFAVSQYVPCKLTD